jgi:hypothetical protein
VGSLFKLNLVEEDTYMEKRKSWLVALTILTVVFATACQRLSGPMLPTPVEQPSEPKSAESVEPSTEPTVIFTPTAEPEVEVLDSFPFRRELRDEGLLHGETAFFCGKEGVTMRISPATAQTNLAECCRDQDFYNPACVESAIGVNDAALVEDNVVTLYGYIPEPPTTYPSTQVPPLSAWVRAEWVYKDGFVGWGALGIFDKTGHISQLHPGWNELLLVIGYIRGDPSGMTREAKQELIKASMAGSPPDEVLVEGYMRAEIYIPEPPDTSGFADRVELGQVAVVEDEDVRYIIDMRESFTKATTISDEKVPLLYYRAESWKIAKATGDVIAYSCAECTPRFLAFEGILPISFTDGTVLVYDVVGLPAGYMADYLKIQKEQGGWLYPHGLPIFGPEEFETWWKLGPSGY